MTPQPRMRFSSGQRHRQVGVNGMENQSAPRKVAIIGAGGHGREILDVIESINEQSNLYEVVGFIVEEGYGKIGDDVNGRLIVVISNGFLSDRVRSSSLGAVALPWRLRFRLVGASARGALVLQPGSPFGNSHPMDRGIGAGVVIMAGRAVTNRVTLSDHVHLNLTSPSVTIPLLGDSRRSRQASTLLEG